MDIQIVIFLIFITRLKLKHCKKTIDITQMFALIFYEGQFTLIFCFVLKLITKKFNENSLYCKSVV
jgi:hypothetical protein